YGGQGRGEAGHGDLRGFCVVAAWRRRRKRCCIKRRFDCRARLGFTTRHRRGLVRPGPESVDPLGAPAALRGWDDNRERGSRHHVVERASLWACRILAFGGPASPRTRLDREYAFTSWLYSSVNVLSCD